MFLRAHPSLKKMVAIILCMFLGVACIRKAQLMNKRATEPVPKGDGLKLAPTQGPIAITHISEILRPVMSQPRPSREAMVKRLGQKESLQLAAEPALAEADFEQLTAKEKQIIAVLVNRSQLAWEQQHLVDYLGHGVSRQRLADYLERTEMSLAYYQRVSDHCASQACEAEGFKLTSEEGGQGAVVMDADEAEGESGPDTLVTTLGLMTAVGTLFWGQREWSTNENIIRDAEAMHKLNERVSQLEARHKLGSLEHPSKLTPPNPQDLAAVRSKAAGDLLDPSSAKFGKYVFSPLLLATGLAALGVTLNEIK